MYWGHTNDKETTNKIYKLAKIIKSEFTSDDNLKDLTISPELYFEYSEIFLNKRLLRRLNTLTNISHVTVRWLHKGFDKMDYKVVAIRENKT